jgi:potassium efflux system protein
MADSFIIGPIISPITVIFLFLNVKNNMTRFRSHFCAWILLILLQPHYVIAAEMATPTSLDETPDIENLLSAKEKVLSSQTLSEHGLQQLTKNLSDINTTINSRITAIESESQKLSDQITSLGQEIAQEPEDVRKKRHSLQKQKLDAEKRLSQYRLLLLRSEEMLSKAQDILQNTLAARLLNREPTLIDLVSFTLNNLHQLFDSYAEYFSHHHGLNKIPLFDYILLAIMAAATLAAGYWIRARIFIWCTTKQWGTRFISNFTETFTLTTSRFLPWLFLTTSLAVYSYEFFHGFEPLPLAALVAYGLPAFILTNFLIQLFFKPKLPARLFIPIPETVAKRLGHRFTVLATVGYIAYVFLMILYLQKSPHQFLQFARDVLVVLAVLNISWILFYSRRIPQFSQKTMPRVAGTLLLMLLMTLELMGYRNLVLAVSKICGIILVCFVLLIMLHRMTKEFYDGLDTGAQQWHRKLRSKLGLTAEQPVPGLTAVRLITWVLLWGGFAFIVISLLDFSGAIQQHIVKILFEGISLGNLNINPTRLLLAIIIFSMLYTLSSWIKIQIDTHWMSKSRIERGAKEALVTISGYIGVAIAIVLALGIAGVTLTNVAIIAGALSVGIGFGLQNIVNNFVSGLILLFERPIKNGDWIIVGDTEGHVKKISIRSTQIQTFDHADIIVPNSELVSSQVTNWMLHDRTGRIRLPVGVAYGSDTEKVRQILYGVANDHPKVIKNNSNLPTKIFFLQFGDSSLDFELRCFIQDIDNALSVKSDLNFAIDKAFKENGIEIPFPQRDVHIKRK